MTTDTTYQYTNDYIPTSFWDILDQKLVRVRVLKDVTGCGATYGVMQKPTPDRKRFLVMPTIKLIQDKQRQADNGEFGMIEVISLHSESPHTANNIDTADIVLMTPDQMVMLFKDKDTFLSINHHILVVDEEHTFEGAGAYREAFGQLEHIMQHWDGSVVTITATEPFAVSPYFEQFDVIRLHNPLRPVRTVEVTRIPNVFFGLLDRYIATGERIVIVTNDIKMFRIIRKRCDDVITITGQSLKSKLLFEGFKQGVADGNNQIIIISTSATEGIDFNLDAHVMIMSNYAQPPFIFSLQTMIQALGRPRGKLLDSLICIDIPDKDSKTIHVADVATSIAYVENVIDKIDNDKTLVDEQKQDKKQKLDHTMEINGQHVVNTQSVCGQISSQVNYNIFHADDYIDWMNKYGNRCGIKFQPVSRLKISTAKRAGNVKFHEVLETAKALPLKDLKDEFETQRMNITGDFYGNISKRYIIANLLCQLRYTAPADIVAMIDGKHLSFARATKLLNSIAIMSHLLDKDSKGDDPVMQIEPATALEKLRAKLKNKNKAPLRASLKRVTPQAISQIRRTYGSMTEPLLTQKQIDVVQIIHYLSKQNTETKKIVAAFHKERVERKRLDWEAAANLKKQWTGLINELTGLSVNYYTKDRQREYATRTYSAVTDLPISLINEIHPHDVLEIDISSANPTFIDMLVGSNLRYDIYNRIMKYQNVSRDEAKELYNRLLNSTLEQWKYRSPRITKEKQLRVWGYTKAQAQQISDYSTYKANMFYEMTRMESKAIEEIKGLFNDNDAFDSKQLNTIRRHDAIVVFGQKDNMKDLIEKVKNAHFDDFKIHYTTSW